MNAHKLLPLLLAALLAACASKPADLPDEDLAAIRYADSALANRLVPTEVIRVPAGDVLRAQVNLRNASSFKVNYQYKFIWFDANGLEISQGGENWQPAQVSGRGDVRLQGVAPNPAAVRFQLWLQDH